ncbi:MAG: hypothetical protein D6732_14820 [Methanobacteriota archaeon]|nr:MAG: hypothetical protein D6732_14820 [Euryarchaeota archaeon]
MIGGDVGNRFPVPKEDYDRFVDMYFKSSVHREITREDFAEKQFLLLCRMLALKSESMFQRQDEVRMLFGTKDDRVLSVIFNWMIKPVSDVLPSSLEEIRALDVEQVRELLVSLPISQSRLNGMLDVYDFTLFLLSDHILWNETIARRILEGGFITLNPAARIALERLGFPSIDFISDETIGRYRSLLKNFDSVSVNAKVIECVIQRVLDAIRIQALATADYDKKGTDVIIKFDLVKSITFPEELSCEDKRVVHMLLENLPHPRRLHVYEMKVSGGNTYDVLVKFMDRETGQIKDGGLNVFKRTSDDLKGFISRLNTHFGISGKKWLNPNLIREVLDFHKFFGIHPTGCQRDRLRCLFKATEKEGLVRERLAGKALVEFMEESIQDDIIEQILSFLDTMILLTDLAAIEEFMRSGKVFQLDFTSLENYTGQAVEVKSRMIPVQRYSHMREWLLLGPPLLNHGNNSLEFGFDLYDQNGRKVPLDANPFKFSGEEIQEMFEQPQFMEAMREIFESYKNRQVSRLMDLGRNRKREMAHLSSLLRRLKNNRVSHYFTPRENGIFPFLDELPEVAQNYLKQKLLERLTNGETGIVSELSGRPIRITKGIIGTGDEFFFRGINKLFGNRLLLPVSYGEVVITSRQGWNLGTMVEATPIICNLSSVPSIIKARFFHDGYKWFPHSNGIRIMKMSKGKRLDLNHLVDLITKREIKGFIGEVFTLKYPVTEKSTYSFRQPSGLVEISVDRQIVFVNGHEFVIIGTLVDISRPIKDIRNTANIYTISGVWKQPSQSGSKSRFYWQAALETLEKNLPDMVMHYNEMVYLADLKSKIGTFLTPLLDILDEKSRSAVETTAIEQANLVADKLKHGKKDQWPCNVTYTGRDGKVAWRYEMQTGKELPRRFRFELNENNMMAWYLDAVVRNPEMDVPLSIREEPECQEMLNALTLSDMGTRFRIADIILGLNLSDLSNEMRTKIFRNQDGLIRYLSLLERRGRTMTFEGLEKAKEAISNYWYAKDGGNLLRKKPRRPIDTEMLSMYLPLLVIPPNLVKGTSGVEIPIKLKYYEKNDYPFIPCAISQEDLNAFMQKHGVFQDHLLELQNLAIDFIHTFPSLEGEGFRKR